jgi:hypothetical protein
MTIVSAQGWSVGSGGGGRCMFGRILRERDVGIWVVLPLAHSCSFICLFLDSNV